MNLTSEIKTIKKMHIEPKHLATIKKRVLDILAESLYTTIRNRILGTAKRTNQTNIAGSINPYSFTSISGKLFYYSESRSGTIQLHDNKNQTEFLEFSIDGKTNKAHLSFSIDFDFPIANINEIKAFGIECSNYNDKKGKEARLVDDISLGYVEEEYGFLGLKRKIYFSNDIIYIEKKMQELSKTDKIKIKKEADVQKHRGKDFSFSDEAVIKQADQIQWVGFTYEFQLQ